MRYLIAIVSTILLFAGCSGSSGNPTVPDGSDTQIIPRENSTGILYSGTFEIDLENQIITQTENRQSDLVYNITGFLPTKCPGGCFRFSIVGIVGTVLEIELTLENPLTIQIYDARVVYVDLFGKSVLNPHSYTDFRGTMLTRVFPFTAFMSDTSGRAFPVGPGGMDSETLFLDFPPGSIAAVNYMITCSFPNQTQEPYEINSMMQSGFLSPSGGSATVSCKVLDHQDDVSGVYLDATSVMGAMIPMVPNGSMPNLWEVSITNSVGAPVGDYHAMIAAQSPNSQAINTYNYVDITVSLSGPADPIAIINTDPDPAEVSVMDPVVTFDGSASYDPDGGPITLYEWDLDYTGIPAEFDPEIVGMESSITQNYSCLTGTYLVALRVTDDDTPAGVSEIESVEVTVIDDRPIGTWEGSTELGQERIDGDALYMTCQSLQVDSNGRTHILTWAWDAVSYVYYLHYRTFDGVTISPPTVIPGTPSSFRMFTSCIDNDDELHIVWFAGYPGTTLQHTQTSGGAFTGVVEDLFTEDRDGYILEMMNISKNADGDIMVTWLDHNVDFVDPHFMYTINDGSGFSTAEFIPYTIHLRRSPDPSPGYTNVAPNLVSTPDGNFHQIYYANEYDLAYNLSIFDLVYNGTSWAAPRVAYDPSSSYQIPYDISVAAGSDGNIHITGPMDGSMRYIRYDSTSDMWQDAIVMATGANGFPYGAVEVDGYGFVHAVYAKTDGQHRLKVFCQYADGATVLASPEIYVDTNTRTFEHCHTDLQWDNDGNLMALYMDTRGDTYTYFNRFLY